MKEDIVQIWSAMAWLPQAYRPTVGSHPRRRIKLQEFRTFKGFEYTCFTNQHLNWMAKSLAD
jgi:hypothetical protein